MSERLPGGDRSQLPHLASLTIDDSSVVAAEAPQAPEDPYRRLLRDLSRMAKPALVAHLRGQVVALHEAMGLRKGDVLASKSVTAQRDLFERYGLNGTLIDVLLENNPEGRVSVRPTDNGAMWVSGRNQAELFLRPDATYPFLHLDLNHENEYRKKLSSYLGHEEALKAIGSPVLNEADEYLRRTWRLDALEGITEEYRNAQALGWSVAHAAHDSKLIAQPLYPRVNRDILTVR